MLRAIFHRKPKSAPRRTPSPRRNNNNGMARRAVGVHRSLTGIMAAKRIGHKWRQSARQRIRGRGMQAAPSPRRNNNRVARLQQRYNNLVRQGNFVGAAKVWSGRN